MVGAFPTFNHVQPLQSSPLEVTAAHLVFTAVISPFFAVCGAKSTALASEKGINVVLTREAAPLPPLQHCRVFPCRALGPHHSAVVYREEICGL